MEEQEKVQVKVVADDSPAPTKQEQEAAVLDQAVETGEVASEYGLQDDGVYKVNLDKPPVQKEEKDAIPRETTDSLQDTGEKGSESGETPEVALRGQSDEENKALETKEQVLEAVSYTHLTLPTTPYV